MDAAQRTSLRPVMAAVDGSGESDAAVRWAAEEAARRGAGLQVVHVWSSPVVPWPTPFTGAVIDPAPFEAEARRVLEDAQGLVRRELGDRAPDIEPVLVQGPVVTRLMEASVGADLLVLGSRGRGGFASLLLGSVASGCAHHTTIPLAVIQGRGVLPGNGRVVVGVDDSAGGRAALRWAAVEAARLGSPLEVVHGWETPYAVPPGGMAFAPIHDAEFVEAADRLTAGLVDEVLADLPDRPEVTCRSVPQTAPQALLTEAKGAGLLVVGSRGRGSIAGLVLGSVSQQCLHHAPCPIVVVPTRTAPGGGSDGR